MSEDGKRLYGTSGYHDCVESRCDTDDRTREQIVAEGRAAGEHGVAYANCPYGHFHPDVRFDAWVHGWAQVMGRWCDEHCMFDAICWDVHEASSSPARTRFTTDGTS